MRLFILLSFVATLCGQAVTPEARIAHAEKLHAGGDLGSAEKILLGVIDDKRTSPAWLPRAYMDLGVVCHDQGRLGEAERWYSRSRRLVTPDSTLHMQVLNNLASLHLENGQIGKAERAAAELARLTPPPGELEIRMQSTAAAVHMARGRNREAEQMFITVLAGWEKSGRPRDVAVVLNNLGVLALERKDVRTALTRLQRSWELWQQEIGGDHVMFVHTMANYGAALLASGQTSAAEEHLSRALALATKWYGAEEPLALQISAIYANALTANGRKKEAKDLRAKVARASSALTPKTVDVLDFTYGRVRTR